MSSEQTARGAPRLGAPLSGFAAGAYGTPYPLLDTLPQIEAAFDKLGMSTKDHFDPSQYGQADRREVDPPIQVEMATWSRAGQLDWWVLEHRPRLEWFGVVRVPIAGSGGPKLVIFVAPAAHSHKLLAAG
jgi:hypothetical protein